MTHLSPINNFSCYAFCLRHNITSRFALYPLSYMDGPSWSNFFSSIEEPFSLLLYYRYYSFLSFLTHASGFDFIPITGLRGVTIYYPLAVTSQFHQTQGLHSFTGTVDYCFPILASTESELLRVYDMWQHHVLAEFRDSHHGRTPEYQS